MVHVHGVRRGEGEGRARLLAVSHRPDVLARCVDEGLNSHPVIRSFPTHEPLLPFPHVLKEWDLHRGEGKHLIRSADDLPGWEGEATAEPFFVGESVRVLLIEDDFFGAPARGEEWVASAARRQQLWLRNTALHSRGQTNT